MKKIIPFLLALALPLAAAAQTNTAATNTVAAPQVQNQTQFYQTAMSWMTSFSSNSWTGTHGFAEAGAASQNNVDVASTLGLGYNVWSASTNSGITLNSVTLNAGIAGVIDEEIFGAAWRLNIKDVQLLAGVGGGYNWPDRKGFGELFAELQKKMTANTHLFIRMDEQWEGKISAPIVSAGAGFEF